MNNQINLPLNASLDLETGNFWVNGKLLTLDEYMLAVLEEESVKNTPNFKFALDPNLPEFCEKYNKSIKDEKDLLTPEMFLPTSANTTDAGADVRCAEPEGITLKPGSYVLMNLGFRCFCPSGWWVELKPRSSTFAKKHCHALYGTIDEDYPDPWKFAIHYLPDTNKLNNKDLFIPFGERIAQIIPRKRESWNKQIISVEELENLIKDRNSTRSGGFGSTGNK